MRVFHPAQPYQGIPPENVFLVADSANMTVAQGFLVHTYHPYLFPERPVNMFITLASKGAGRDMLLGALLARAYQLRTQTPYLRARVFTQCGLQEGEMLAFLGESGFVTDDALDVLALNQPSAKPSAPMGYDMGQVPLSTPMEQTAFLMRMNTYRLDVLQQPLLLRYMQLPHFLALYIARGQEIVGEILLAGEGASAKILGLYVMPNYRRLGLGKSLIAAGMNALRERGVSHFEGDVIRRNLPQCALAASCSATFVRTACLYPGVNYD